MTEVRFLPPAAKFLKKMKDTKLKGLYQEAIDRIREDHTVGGRKAEISSAYTVMTFSTTKRTTSRNTELSTLRTRLSW